MGASPFMSIDTLRRVYSRCQRQTRGRQTRGRHQLGRPATPTTNGPARLGWHGSPARNCVARTRPPLRAVSGCGPALLSAWPHHRRRRHARSRETPPCSPLGVAFGESTQSVGRSLAGSLRDELLHARAAARRRSRRRTACAGAPRRRSTPGTAATCGRCSRSDRRARPCRSSVNSASRSSRPLRIAGT